MVKLEVVQDRGEKGGNERGRLSFGWFWDGCFPGQRTFPSDLFSFLLNFYTYCIFPCNPSTVSEYFVYFSTVDSVPIKITLNKLYSDCFSGQN